MSLEQILAWERANRLEWYRERGRRAEFGALRCVRGRFHGSTRQRMTRTERALERQGTAILRAAGLRPVQTTLF
jgi:hypothetical protein